MSPDRPFRLRLIHFNDLHGRLADVEPREVTPVFSRIAGFIRQARQEMAGQPRAGVLALAGGDELVGSAFAELAGTRPERFLCHPAYRLYSAAGVDATVVGNHDLDWGLGMLSLAAASDAKFPLLSANLAPRAEAGAARIRRSIILDVNGLRVGLLGLTTDAEIKRLPPVEFEVGDPLAAAFELLPPLQASSDVVIILSHLGRGARDTFPPARGMRDEELARALPAGAVPIIIGGHTHTVLNENGLDPANFVNGVLLAHAGSDGRFVGDVLLEVAPGRARVVDARLWPVKSLPTDPEFESRHVLPLARPVQRLLAEPVGRVVWRDPVERPAGEAFAAGESALANFVADALVARCRAAGLMVDLAMLDSPALSGNLPADGELVFGDLFRLTPFADSIVLMRLPARDLQAFLDDNARRVDLPGEPVEERGFVQFSREVRYRIAGTETGSRADMRATGATLGGLPLSDAARTERDLIVARSSFFREFCLLWERRAQEQGLAPFEAHDMPHEVTRLAMREELVAYIRGVGEVTEATGLARDGRVVFEAL